MLVVLAAAGLLALLTFYRAHRNALLQFNAFDLIMVDGKVDRVALAFMVAFAVTTWAFAYLTIQGKMTDTLFGVYGGMWVAPLVLKVVFNKSDPAGITSTTMTVQQVTKP